MEFSSELIEIESGKKISILASCWASLARLFSNALHLRK
jgi:hypothetical protein